MNNYNIAFIGAGNLAKAIISGLISNSYPAKKIWASNPTSPKLNALYSEFGINTTTSNLDAAVNADILILTVKPINIAKVCQEIREVIAIKNPLLISTAVGATTTLIQQYIGTDRAVILAMPNIPATVKAAATGLYANNRVHDFQKEKAENIFRSIGITLWVEKESDIGIVCSLSGSGPAYIFYVMEAIQKTGEKLGLSKKVAMLLTEQTVIGASKMALESGETLENLRQAVTSPKGTTEQAIKILDKFQVFEAFEEAISSAVKRYKEVTQILTNEAEKENGTKL